MNLADRLRAVVKPSTSTAAGSPSPPSVPSPADAGTAPRSGPSRLAHLEGALGGEWRDSAPGRSFVVVRRYGPDARYGHSTVGQLAARLAEMSGCASLVSAPAARPPFLFFDLETTGLSGGAGTYAFMVGCGWFDATEGFVTEQHLLVDYASERTMLHAVATELERAGALVSFNGKSFDVPVLETRYSYNNRMTSPCGELPHLDVLHPARRFWENDESCSLTTLERQVLGASRIGDVPGFEIPGRYFQFIRSGDPGPLAAVFEHNRLDLLSLAGLTARLLHLIGSGPLETGNAREALALGRVYAGGGLERRAAESFEHALGLCDAQRAPSRGDGTSAPVEVEALRSLAVAARRARHYEAAAIRWRQVLDVPGCPNRVLTEASEALAIHHEHRARDLVTARMFALKTLEMQSLGRGMGVKRSLVKGSGPACGDAVRHRLARIERKMVSELPLFPS